MDDTQIFITLASNCDDSTPNCVDDHFYERATTYLVAKEKKDSDEIERQERIMTKSEVQTIKRKKWTVNSNNQIITGDNMVVLSKSQIIIQSSLIHIHYMQNQQMKFSVS